MRKVKVHLQAQRQICIHNDIGNAAFYFKRRVDERIAQNDRVGVAHEIIAGLTLLAFEVEARFNFLGFKLIEKWDERQPAKAKVKAVCNHLGVDPDFTARPYLSVEKLRACRDTLAHGKPEYVSFEKEVVATAEELEAMVILRAGWGDYIDQGFLNESYNDTEEIWKDLLAKSGLTVFDALTHGSSQMSFLEHVES